MAVCYNSHSRTYLFDHFHLMSDHHDRHSEFSVDLLQQFKYLDRSSGIQRGDSLITQQHFRIAGKRSSYGNSLLLATGELRRESAGSSGKQSELDRTLKEVRSSEAERKAKKQAEAEERRKARREEEIENRIHELEGMIADIEEEMSDPEKAADFEWMHEKSELMAAYETEISELYDKWMELQ